MRPHPGDQRAAGRPPALTVAGRASECPILWTLTVGAFARCLDAMRRASAAIDDTLLRRLYVDANLTAQRIATQLECSPTTILRRLRRFGISPRHRGPGPGRNTPLAWSAEAAYAVGLAATDGNLSSDGRHMSFISKDRDLVETFRRCLELTTLVRTLRTRTGSALYRVQWCDRRLYDWFLSLGLMPAKSLRLGRLAVPDDRFADFFRGCIDGDGSVLVYTDRYHSGKNDRYVYERLYVSLVSASRPFVDWVRKTVTRLAHIAGAITRKGALANGQSGSFGTRRPNRYGYFVGCTTPPTFQASTESA
jgi:hypothetical protein